jgi:hypothetical protein
VCRWWRRYRDAACWTAGAMVGASVEVLDTCATAVACTRRWLPRSDFGDGAGLARQPDPKSPCSSVLTDNGVVCWARGRYNIWSVARVLLVIPPNQCLIQFEGWGSNWTLWLDRRLDLPRIRPLTEACEGRSGGLIPALAA